ncbi:hypothetical protein XthCFBP4691_12850 [Xanthomonas theicola]|uniref:Uncharacterized protein n=1 Tax=Xanthomonas theicola TaxID=56464 RepID=A0A2S6ZDI6_9XANT|nr:hypothetical protein XthCFBP4691_12850 [Xanthomonas theicola]
MVHFSPRLEASTMGQVLHGSAATTEAIGRAMQQGQESLRALSKRDGIHRKTVAKLAPRCIAACSASRSPLCWRLDSRSRPANKRIIARPRLSFFGLFTMPKKRGF